MPISQFKCHYSNKFIMIILVFSFLFFSDSIGLHRMENPSHCEKAITLHLYSPPFIMCNTFDQKTGHRTQIPMTFWSKYGEKTPTVSNLKSQTNYNIINVRVWKRIFCKHYYFYFCFLFFFQNINFIDINFLVIKKR